MFHLSSFCILFILVFATSSVLFLKSSILDQVDGALQKQPEFIVQQMQGGRQAPISENLLYELDAIFGVNAISGRVHGKYFHPVGDSYFKIVGIDPFDEVLSLELREMLQKVDINRFLDGGAIVGSGVAKFLQQNHYGKSYHLFAYEGGSHQIEVLKKIDPRYAVTTNNLIIVDQDLARQILGLEYGSYSDITLRVDNELEFDTISNRIYTDFANVRVITKEQMQRAYQNSFDFKSGMFLSLSIMGLILVSFMLYFKYSHTTSSSKKEIGILRALGWSIKDVLKLKFFETFIVGSTTFMLSFIAAYLYIFAFDGFLLKELFLGFSQTHDYSFVPAFEISLFVKLFLFFVTTFCAAVLVPVWRLSITSSKEAMK